jgi:3-oxoacyl-[acyl-carrier protein] reductase
VYNTEFVKDLFSLEGHVAIITGGASGIGKRTAFALAAAGAAITVADRNRIGADEVAHEIQRSGGKAIGVEVDVGNEASMLAMFKASKNAFGNVRILVSCAAIFPRELIADLTVEQWDRVIDIDLRSIFIGTREAVRQMREEGKGGRIISVSSVDSLQPSYTGLGHYAAAKAGINGFTRSAAVEFAPDNILINALLPGSILTEGAKVVRATLPEEVMLPGRSKILLKRPGDPKEVASAILFLASKAASYVTGQMIVVDGGRTIA